MQYSLLITKTWKISIVLNKLVVFFYFMFSMFSRKTFFSSVKISVKLSKKNFFLIFSNLWFVSVSLQFFLSSLSFFFSSASSIALLLFWNIYYLLFLYSPILTDMLIFISFCNLSLVKD